MDKDSDLIRLSDIHFGYSREKVILKGLNFKLRAGENIGLIGSNGSGKTTILQLIIGLLKPDSGTVEVLGRPCMVEKDFTPIREKVGLLFQDANDQLFCPTVEEDIAFGPLNLGKNYRDVRLIVQNTLETIGMKGFETRPTYNLSGGEKKLISLATILAMSPDVLLLDEPTNGLDDPTRKRVIDIFDNLPQAKIIVSHDFDFLSQVVERMYNLQNGRLHPWG